MRSKHMLHKLLYLLGMMGLVLSGFVYAQGNTLPLSGFNSTTNIALLETAARQNGTVRVIVGLNTAGLLNWGASAPSSGQMSDTMRAQSVANLQNALLSTLNGQAHG